MASVVKSIGVIGIEGYLVDVEVSVYDSITSVTSIVGLGDMAVKEAKDRVEAAYNELKMVYPKKKVVINLSPSDIKKAGTYYDLPIIIGIMIESGKLTPVDFSLKDHIFLGEIGLNGELKRFAGVLPMVIAAKRNGFTKVILPSSCLQEASVLKGLDLYAFDHLIQVIKFIQNKIPRKPCEPKAVKKTPDKATVDFSEVYGHRNVIEYVVAAAAGNHNILLIGPPGCGKSMIAKRMPTILPDMTEDEILEVTSIYSICGKLKEGELMDRRPFDSPHYRASPNSLIGGGVDAKPGAITLAHNGILFLDEFPEFNRATLESLRQPMEDGVVTISRVKHINVFPAKFQLVAAMNPCPCGYYGTGNCKCKQEDIRRYSNKISGPILDRIDIQKYLGLVSRFEEQSDNENPSSAILKERVETARRIQLKRFEKISGVNFNGQMDTPQIKEFCSLNSKSNDLLEKSYKKYQFSNRTYNKIIKIARTFADMDESDKIYEKHLICGLMARDMDKDKNTMLVK